MRCQIINIGDELLIGQVTNTNAAWMGQQLIDIGIAVESTIVIADSHAVICQSLKSALGEYDLVLITGGLGPTKDDITKKAIADVCDVDMVFSQKTYDRIRRIYERFGWQMTEAHREQCFMPANVTLLKNAMGTAPGMQFKSGDTNIVSMPGVPNEMQYLMTEHVLPFAQNLNGDASHIIRKTISTIGIGETRIAEQIEDIVDTFPDWMSIAYLPRLARVRVRVSGKGHDGPTVRSSVDRFVDRIAEKIGKPVYATEDISIERAIGMLFESRGSTLSVAESCTGGYLSHLLTSIPGSSRYFIGGGIVYSNGLKEKLVGVRPATLDAFGAVSEETVSEMAAGSLERFGSDYAIALSGIAGPGGGTEEKPVGTVWIAVAGPNDFLTTRKLQLGTDRLRNIELSAIIGLDMLRMAVDQEDSLRER